LGKTFRAAQCGRHAHFHWYRHQSHAFLFRNRGRGTLLSKPTPRIQDPGRMGAGACGTPSGFHLWRGLHCSRRRHGKFSRRSLRGAVPALLIPDFPWRACRWLKSRSDLAKVASGLNLQRAIKAPVLPHHFRRFHDRAAPPSESSPLRDREPAASETQRSA